MGVPVERERRKSHRRGEERQGRSRAGESITPHLQDHARAARSVPRSGAYADGAFDGGRYFAWIHHGAARCGIAAAYHQCGRRAVREDSEAGVGVIDGAASFAGAKSGTPSRLWLLSLAEKKEKIAQTGADRKSTRLNSSHI